MTGKTSDRTSDGRFAKNNTITRQHGVYAFLLRTEPVFGALDALSPEAQDALDAVMSVAEAEGIPGLQLVKALRFEVAAELAYRRMMSEPRAFNKTVKVWGWLNGAALRAWRELDAVRPDSRLDAALEAATEVIEGG